MNIRCTHEYMNIRCTWMLHNKLWWWTHSHGMDTWTCGEHMNTMFPEAVCSDQAAGLRSPPALCSQRVPVEHEPPGPPAPSPENLMTAAGDWCLVVDLVRGFSTLSSFVERRKKLLAFFWLWIGYDVKDYFFLNLDTREICGRLCWTIWPTSFMHSLFCRHSNHPPWVTGRTKLNLATFEN